MKTKPFLIHALSSLHAGTGHSAEVIDLPTARMKATGIPFVPGSSIKGVLRDARSDGDQEKWNATFGPSPWDDPSKHAGALVVGDARLWALPIRSFKGTFAWVSCPLLLFLAQRDLEIRFRVPEPKGRGAYASKDCVCRHGDQLYLEDLDLPVDTGDDLGSWTALLAALVSPGRDVFSQRFVVVDDETMTFLWETGTQIDTRVRLDPTTRTVAEGALWLEESLPAETLLVGLLAADRSRRDTVTMTPEQVLEFALPSEQIIQLGGKASIGRGRCRLLPVRN